MPCLRDGPYSSESDVGQAAALYLDREGDRLAGRLFVRWGHVLATVTRIEELAITTGARRGHAPASVNPAAL